jgi:hypothetical protein
LTLGDRGYRRPLASACSSKSRLVACPLSEPTERARCEFGKGSMHVRTTSPPRSEAGFLLPEARTRMPSMSPAAPAECQGAVAGRSRLRSPGQPQLPEPAREGAFYASLKILGRLAEALGVEPAELLKLPEKRGDQIVSLGASCDHGANRLRIHRDREIVKTRARVLGQFQLFRFDGQRYVPLGGVIDVSVSSLSSGPRRSVDPRLARKGRIPWQKC